MLFHCYKKVTNYKGTVIFDEYCKNVPMYWSFEKTEDFKNTVKYLKPKLETAEKPQNKTLLILEIEEDAQLASLTEEERAFIDKYFV